MQLPTRSGVTRYIQPRLTTLAPPETKMSATAPAGGWSRLKRCETAIAVAGASACAAHFGRALANSGPER